MKKKQYGRAHAAPPLARRMLLLFQEQIQASKNAPIARFDGLGCY